MSLRPLFFTCAVGGCSWMSARWYFSIKQTRPLKPNRFKESESILGQVVKWWNNRPSYDKFFYSVASVNVFIWCLWKTKHFKPFLLKHFTTSPAKSNSVASLLFCTFSHIEVWHIAINMAVLWSFVPSFISIVGEEWAWPYYLTSGTFASMCGHYFKLLRKVPSVPSLGASGALLAVATIVILNNPDSSLYIIFLPFIPIPAYIGLGGIICFDVFGLIRGWRLFDHAAHLGGVSFAICCYSKKIMEV